MSRDDNRSLVLAKAAQSLTLSLALGATIVGLTTPTPVFAESCEPGWLGCNAIFSDCEVVGGGSGSCACERVVFGSYRCVYC